MLRNFRQLLQDDAPSYGDVVRIPVGKTDLYVVSHPDYLQHILRDNHKSYSRGGLGSGFLKRVIGRGLIVLEGQEWLTERRMMQPYFHRKYFPALIDTMAQAVDETLETLDSDANGEIVDLVPFIKRLTITVFLRAMYSMSLDNQTIARIGSSFDAAMRLSSLRDRYNYFLPSSFRLPI